MDYGDYNVFDGLELMVQITPCTVDESLNMYLKNVAIIPVMYQRGENVTTCYIMCKKKVLYTASSLAYSIIRFMGLIIILCKVIRLRY